MRAAPLNIFLISLLLVGAIPKACTPSISVPGVIVSHIPAKTLTYPSSPSICILPNGDYVAAFNLFGPRSNEWKQAITEIFRSSDSGKSWKKISEINGQFWSNLFVHNDILYIMGTWNHNGNFIIRNSLDGGISWSKPDNNNTGLLLEGRYHTDAVPVVNHNGRLWRALEYSQIWTSPADTHLCPMVISAPIEADLLDASNWRESNYLPYDTTYLDGRFYKWTEGNVVITPEGKIVNILRVGTLEKGRELAAIVNVSDDGSTLSFDPLTGFIDFIGGATKFCIRYDKISGLYWTITNMPGEEFSDRDAAEVRNKLVLKSSYDLKNWVVNKMLLYHPDIKKHGFQYVDWQIDGNDIIFLSRTAYDDEFGGAHSFHDANYVTFHRIENFRDLAKN